MKPVSQSPVESSYEVTAQGVHGRREFSTTSKLQRFLARKKLNSNSTQGAKCAPRFEDSRGGEENRCKLLIGIGKWVVTGKEDRGQGKSGTVREPVGEFLDEESTLCEPEHFCKLLILRSSKSISDRLSSDTGFHPTGFLRFSKREEGGRCPGLFPGLFRIFPDVCDVNKVLNVSGSPAKCGNCAVELRRAAHTKAKCYARSVLWEAVVQPKVSLAGNLRTSRLAVSEGRY